ncbi:MAG: DUF4019 domain-containing protein [Rhodanobacteraceae bacterium]
MFLRAFLCALLIGVAGIASAQTQPAPAPTGPANQPLTPEERAAAEKQDQELAQYAESLVQMIDNGRSGQVWDQASNVARQSVSRAKFVEAIKASRADLGTVASRKVISVTHESSKGGKLPAGRYISVNFATQFSKESKPLRELVSFHEDSDHKWRLSGYHLFTPAGDTPTAKR